MRRGLTTGLMFAAGLLLAASLSTAQPPDGGGKGGKSGKGFGRTEKGGKGSKGGEGGGDPAAAAGRFLAFDADKDGKVSKDELTDDRLKRLFDRADADKDGFVTKAEAETALAAEGGAAGREGGPPGGFPGGPGGPGGFAPPRPGTILPPFLQDRLELTADQKKRLDALQKEVDGKLEKILTADQRKQLKEMGPPGGFPGGPPGGFPGGPGGDGPPPTKKDRRPPPKEGKGKDDGPPAEAPPPKPVDAGPVSAAAVRGAVEKALPVLRAGAAGHSAERSCFTCHHHALPLLALATARGRGFAVTASEVKELTAFVADDMTSLRDRLLDGRGPGPLPAGGGPDNTSYALLALEAGGHAPDDTTAALAEFTLNWDKGRGHWFTPAPRPPSEASSFTVTALSVRGLARYATAAQKGRADERVAAARGWLLKTPATDTEDRVFRLVGLKAAGADPEAVKAAAKELLDTQRADGGWGQLDRLAADAYATGSALWALHDAGGLPADDPAYRRGVGFLVRTQLGDGSWHVKTRSRAIQRYFETGFPHGKDQFISAAATGWATAALALACPPAGR